MKLALRLGRTLYELEDTMHSSEWPQWQAFYELDPFDDDRREHVLARLYMLVATMFRRKDLPPLRADECMPWIGTRTATAQEVDAGRINIAKRLWNFIRRRSER